MAQLKHNSEIAYFNYNMNGLDERYDSFMAEYFLSY